MSLTLLANRPNAAITASDTAQKQLELSERPWVTFTAQIVSGLHYKPEGAVLTIRFTMKNVGHSPALNVFPIAVAFPEFIGKPEVLARQSQLCDARGGFMPMIPPLFPEDGPYVVNYVVTLEKADIDKVASTAHILLPTITGCIDYRSSFSDKHLQARFAYNVYFSEANANGAVAFSPYKEIPLENLRVLPAMSGNYAQ